MIKVIGDLSPQDKEVLYQMASTHNRILEFGVGASTQILTHYTQGNVISYDTSQEWIDRMKYIFDKVGVKGNCKFVILDKKYEISGRFDFVFIDGYWDMRYPFGYHVWPLIIPGGKIAFHDTRRDKDINNTLRFIEHRWAEVESIQCNYLDSNITLIEKRDKRADWKDWHSDMTDEELGIDWEFKPTYNEK